MLILIAIDVTQIKEHVEKRLKSEMELYSNKTLRSSSSTFNWKEMCFFCCISVTSGEAGRKVQTLEIQENVADQCRKRNDDWGLEVLGRLESCSDLPAEEAIYHTTCHTRFFVINVNLVNGRT